MDLNAYLAILGRNKWVILVTMVVTVAVVAIGTFMATPIYSASTTLRVATASSGSVSYSDYMYADRLMNTYTKIATSRPVLGELAKNLNLQKIPQVSVQMVPSTELIKISVESSNPTVAQDVANGLAEILITQSKELYSGGGKSRQEILGEQLAQAEAELNQARQEYETDLNQSGADSERVMAANEAITLKERTYATLLEQYEQARLNEAIRANIISVVEPAILPLEPSKPRKALNISLGLLIGLVGGVGLVFLLENLSTRLHTSDQIQAVTELGVIGKIPPIKRKRLFVSESRNGRNSFSAFRESFRFMRSKISTQNPTSPNGGPFKTLMFTSSIPGEGKSTVVNNLALAIAQAGQKVVVVDCDLRRPTQHKLSNLSNKVGLSSVLVQHEPLEKALQKTRYPNLEVLSSGPLPQNPTELLGSPLMILLIDRLTHLYDMVLIDTPALLPVVDGAVIAPLVDGVVLVARRNFVREEAVRETCKQLELINARVIGVVVNESEQNGTYYYYHGR